MSVVRDPAQLRAWVVRFYERRHDEPAWIDGVRPRSAFDEALRAVEAAGRHGLRAADYGVPAVEGARTRATHAIVGTRFEPREVAALDVALTYAWLAYARDLAEGRVPARDVDPKWLEARNDRPLADVLAAALAANRAGAALEDLAPRHPQYVGLQHALQTYRQAAREHGDRPLAGDVVPASWRLREIALNLDRWRWMPRDLGNRHILVNIPGYELQVIDGDRPVLAMRVIVGRSDAPTPVFSDRMTSIVFSPYWNIPDSILQKETLPRLASDPEYLLRNQIEVVRGTGGSEQVVDPSTVDWSQPEETRGLRFRQLPGDENALGLVKFIFPNHFAVYLHDTPGDALFNRSARALSHGCIRVEKPVALADYVLHDQHRWTPEAIDAAMHSGQEQAVRLREPLPVHIGYWTAWVQPDGLVRFTQDPYSVDARHDRRMQRGGGSHGRAAD